MQQILIIEDDRALNQGLCKALKTDNNSMQVCSGLYASATDRQIVSCENLKDAKEQMLCGMPSLILLDINLPDGSGLDFLLYRKFLKSSEIVYNRLEIKNDITKERRGLRHDVVYEVFCFGLG